MLHCLVRLDRHSIWLHIKKSEAVLSMQNTNFNFSIKQIANDAVKLWSSYIGTRHYLVHINFRIIIIIIYTEMLIWMHSTFILSTSTSYVVSFESFSAKCEFMNLWNFLYKMPVK